MLGFFRRHQKIFFIVITAVIILSFSVFGTGGVQQAPQGEDGVAFTTIDGGQVKQSELARMRLFLGSDLQDHVASGGAWGNPLNDGVIRGDFLATGLGQMVASHSRDRIEKEITQRAEREKFFRPYIHPGASFLSAVNIWNSVAPGMVELLGGLQSESEPLSDVGLGRRIALYMTEQQFPQALLKQVIRYQEAQTGRPDPNLPGRDLSLFGYHTLEDWFGAEFVTLVCEAISNGSIVAEREGYRVSDEEAWTDLQRHAHAGFEQSRESPYVTASDAGTFLQGSLASMGLDRASATKLWKRVLLFRRLLGDVGSAALMDPLAGTTLASYAGESAELEMVSMPIHLRSGKDLQLFEIYLDRVASDTAELSMPREMRPLERLPAELVYRPYRVEVAEVNRSSLLVKIPLKAIWDWKLEEGNWEQIVARFPALAGCESRDQRFEVLQAADPATMASLDEMAQQAILESHPEWIEEALGRAAVEQRRLNLSMGEGDAPLLGVSDKEQLVKLLEQDLFDYSPDGKNHYRIRVLERGEPQLYSFEEARECGALGILLERQLASFHSKARDRFKGSLEEEREQVANALFAARYRQIGEPLGESQPTGEFCALHRFHAYLNEVRDQGVDEGIAEQWRPVTSRVEVSRSEPRVAGSLPFEMEVGATSKVVEPGDRAPYFFTLVALRPGEMPEEGTGVQDVLRAEAQRHLMGKLLEEWDATLQ